MSSGISTNLPLTGQNQNQARQCTKGNRWQNSHHLLWKKKQQSSLDHRLQSIEGVIGYLDQSIKMGKEPKDLTPIMLFLAKEIKTIRDTQLRKVEK